MQRYDTRIKDGRIYIETGTGDMDVGSLEHIYSITGGNKYTITYDNDFAGATDWLDLDEDGAMTIDVRETLESMDFPAAFVERLSARSPDAGDGEIPERAAFFAESIVTAWDQKGNFEQSHNPFTKDR
jgi:hypothetical protein